MGIKVSRKLSSIQYHTVEEQLKCSAGVLYDYLLYSWYLVHVLYAVSALV